MYEYNINAVMQHSKPHTCNLLQTAVYNHTLITMATVMQRMVQQVTMQRAQFIRM